MNSPVDPVSVFHGLVRNPAFSGVVKQGLRVRDTALQAQETLLGLLNLPTAAELNAVATRLRSISQRLELLEDALDRVDRSVARLPSVLNDPVRQS